MGSGGGGSGVPYDLSSMTLGAELFSLFMSGASLKRSHTEMVRLLSEMIGLAGQLEAKQA